MLILFSFFAMAGAATFGPRYMSDILPILYLLLLHSLKPPELTFGQKLVIVTSSIFNFLSVVYSLLNA